MAVKKQCISKTIKIITKTVIITSNRHLTSNFSEKMMVTPRHKYMYPRIGLQKMEILLSIKVNYDYPNISFLT